jgi:hypothetical protein
MRRDDGEKAALRALVEGEAAEPETQPRREIVEA